MARTGMGAPCILFGAGLLHPDAIETAGTSTFADRPVTCPVALPAGAVAGPLLLCRGAFLGHALTGNTGRRIPAARRVRGLDGGEREYRAREQGHGCELDYPPAGLAGPVDGRRLEADRCGAFHDVLHGCFMELDAVAW